MLCAISGQTPDIPVASRKTGFIYEKRLIESYISENGTEPNTDEHLGLEDLIELKQGRVVRPRPPTLTSIPSLLSAFQNEWDALALEMYTLQQHLKQTRQELSTALYQQDAAVRVIARISKERDEARDALSRVTIARGPTSNGDAMQVDDQGPSDALVVKIERTQERLSATRRKRPVPNDWVTPETLQTFKPLEKLAPLSIGARSMCLNEDGDLAITGGEDGTAGIYSLSQKKLITELEVGGGRITDAIWAKTFAIISTSSGSVKIFENGVEVNKFDAHSGEVTALALHPSQEILASVGVDKSYLLYDLSSFTHSSRVYTDSSLSTAAFHPDGHLFAAGGIDGQIKVYDVKSGTNAANFEMSGPLRTLSFSENGTWLAAVDGNSADVSIWDLRKSAKIKVLEIGHHIDCIRWDYTGQFLAIVGPSGLSVQQYSKSTKEWSEPLRSAIPAIAVDWGLKAQCLVALETDGALVIVGPE